MKLSKRTYALETDIDAADLRDGLGHRVEAAKKGARIRLAKMQRMH